MPEVFDVLLALVCVGSAVGSCLLFVLGRPLLGSLVGVASVALALARALT